MLLRSATDTVRVVRGREKVLELGRRLDELCVQCEQPGALDHLDYHFSLPGFARKRPTMVVVETTTGNGVRPVAAVLTYEYQVAGVGTGVYAADFKGGARAVVAPRSLRPRAVFAAADALLSQRGLLIQLSYVGEDSPSRLAQIAETPLRWASRVRNSAGYMEIEPGVEATFAHLGKRTRRNLRYYRRLAETELGATLVVSPEITPEQFLEFNRATNYAVPDEQAAARFRSLKQNPAPLFLGLRSQQGEWLSLIGGYFKGPDAMVEWQLNRSDMAPYSLCTTMRAHLLEYVVGQNCRRTYFIGGTTHSMMNSMTHERIVDVVVSRPGVPAWLVNRIAAADPDLPRYEGPIAIGTRVYEHPAVRPQRTATWTGSRARLTSDDAVKLLQAGALAHKNEDIAYR
jgi:hypothetical protein